MPKYAVTLKVTNIQQVIIESDKGPPIREKDGFVRVHTEDEGVVIVVPMADFVRCDLIKDQPRIVAPGQPQ